MNTLCTKFQKGRAKKNHVIFEQMISHHRKYNTVFNEMLNQIITPSNKSKARRDAAVEKQRVRQEMLQDAMRMAADAEKKATEAKERAERNLNVEINVRLIISFV